MPTQFKQLPSQEYLLECFDYNPDTGIFTWKERPWYHFKSDKYKIMINKKHAGIVAGYENGGYLNIMINSVPYRSHRIAWKIITGNDPVAEIDHIDLDRTNCKFNNLREAKSKENSRNKNKRSNNTSGYKGVSRYRWGENKFAATIKSDGIFHWLGSFNTQEDAYKAYCEAADKLHGYFARK